MNENGGFLRRETTEELTAQIEQARRAQEDAETAIEKRIDDPCQDCIKNDTCGLREGIQRWREEQRGYARKDKGATFTRTCSHRYQA